MENNPNQNHKIDGQESEQESPTLDLEKLAEWQKKVRDEGLPLFPRTSTKCLENLDETKRSELIEAIKGAINPDCKINFQNELNNI